MENLNLERLPRELTVCKVESLADIDVSAEMLFVAKTDEELSCVCFTDDAPSRTLEREDGWKGFRIKGVLDFSLVGILSRLSGVLADNDIGVFALSTFNTDFILVKKENFEKALGVLSDAGWSID